MLPRIVNPTASDLFAHWGSCQNMAFDVNFVMHVPPRPPLGDSGNGGITPVASGAQRGMLSSSTPPGMLVPGTRESAQNHSGTLLGNRPSTAGQGGGMQSPASKVELNPQPLPPRVQMTNADVLKMLKGHMPESAIISAILSAAHKFDFSPASCRELRAAHVTRQVLDAMGDGSVRPCPEITGTSPAATPESKLERNPQSLPPRTGIGGGTAGSSAKVPSNSQQLPGSRQEASPGSRAAIRPVKLAPPKALRKMTNPRLAEQNASILAALQQQKQAAEQDSAAMQLSSRSGVAARVPSPRLAPNVQRNSLGNGLGPETTQSKTGGIASKLAHLPAFNSTVVTCSVDPSPKILYVSGVHTSTVFTPEAKYNLYTIVGCSFGQSQSGNSAYLFGVNGFKATLNIDFWSDNGITAHLDPWLAGVLDQDNVTLVVAPAGKQQIHKPGFKFYAARGMPGPDGSPQEVQLAYDSIPPSRIGLFNVANFPAGIDQLPANATAKFPSFTFQGTPVAGWVFRYAYKHSDRIATLRTADCYINDAAFNGDPCGQFDTIGSDRRHFYSGSGPWQLKADTWDLSKLAPGFQISSYQLYVSTLDPASLCGSWADLDSEAYLDGDWDYNLNSQNQIVVTWPIYRCVDVEFGTRDNMAVQSAYGLSVGVMGPRCVDPWTGHPDQACMASVHNLLGG
jgi:hypothetical protein